jgi:bifunctional DNA-binding transcriptional regulator/antitoxin component of YhaV-PrlF toxin-antitoxin module
MITLTVTAKGQVTLRRALLKHLGVNPGETITVEKLPDGRIEVKAARPAGHDEDTDLRVTWLLSLSPIRG